MKLFPYAKSKLGVIWVSAVLYLLISVLIMVLVLHIGIPVINKMRDRSILVKQQDTFSTIDAVISDVAYEGPGSRREVPIQIDKGELIVEDGRIAWTMQTDDKLIEPGVTTKVGEVTITSATDVTAEEFNDYYILENSEVKINLTKCSAENDCSYINDIIHSVELKTKSESQSEEDAFDFYIADGVPFEGEGYSHLVAEGEFLDRGRVLYHLDSPEIALELTLRSYVDYLEIRLIEE